MDEDINSLMEEIKQTWQDTKSDEIFKEYNNIKRGHMRSISTDVENIVAMFISKILGKGFNIYIDPTISIKSKEDEKKRAHRPDILIIKNGHVIALIELKTNMGFCRKVKEIEDVIDKITKMDEIFSVKENIECMFSKYDDDGNAAAEKEKDEVDYKKENVKKFLIALTSSNGPKNEISFKNRNYAKEKNVKHYILFDGWYGRLVPRDDLDSFKDDLLKIKKGLK